VRKRKSLIGGGNLRRKINECSIMHKGELEEVCKKNKKWRL
jgi:hypothetical protein